VIIASHEGYFMQGMWQPIRLEDLKILKRAYTDALDLPKKKVYNIPLDANFGILRVAKKLALEKYSS